MKTTTTLTSNGNPRNPNRKKHSRFEFLSGLIHKPATVGQWVNLISGILLAASVIWLAACIIQVSDHSLYWNESYQQPYSWWNFYNWTV